MLEGSEKQSEKTHGLHFQFKQKELKSINSKSFIEYIKSNKIDLIISIAAPKIFKKQLLNTPKFGCINYHSALLPKYRGRQPLFWALYNNEKETGVSIHEMNEKIDDGPILIQEKFLISKKDSLHSLYLKSLEIGPKVLLKAINIIDRQDITRIENKSNNNYYSFPKVNTGKQFRKMGKHFF